MQLKEKYIFLTTRAPLPMLLFVAVITVLFGLQLKHFRVANAFDGWVSEGEQTVEDYKQFLMHFGGYESVVIAMKTQDSALEPHNLETVRLVSDKIFEKCKGVVGVSSLGTIPVPTPGSKGVSYLKPKPGGRLPFDKLKNSPVNGYFISRDEKTAGILVFINISGMISGDDMLESIYSIVEEADRPDAQFHVSGTLAMHHELNRLTKQQVFKFAPLAAVLLLLTLFVFLRRPTDVAIVILGTIVSLVWAIGYYVAAGNALNFLTVAMPPLILVICVGDSIHIIVRFRNYRQTMPHRKALSEALSRTLPPCMFTSLTTAAGFGVLAFSSIPVIRVFGLHSAVGVLMAFFVVTIITPAALSLLGSKRSVSTVSNKPDTMTLLVSAIYEFTKRRRWGILAISSAVFAISFFGMCRLKADINYVEFFKKDYPLRVDTNFIENNLVGLSGLEVIFTAPPERFMTEPRNMQMLLDFENFLLEHQEITDTVSFADYSLEMNRAVTGKEVLPPDNATVWKQIESTGFRNYRENRLYVRNKGRVARVAVRLKHSGSDELKFLMKDIDEYIEKLDPEIQVKVTGGARVYAEMSGEIVQGQVRSLAMALVIISIMMFVLLRSIRWGVIGLIPNLLPVFLTLGAMGLAGIPLNLATMMIASIAIGIAVDDTMHLLTACRTEIESTEPGPPVKRAMLATGRALMSTTVILVCGFGITAGADLVPISQFGLLSALTMVAALAADLFLLPALLLTLTRRQR